MIISFLQPKGGAGKTMLSINVCVGLKKLGHSVLLVDADEQATARIWHTKNNGETLDVIGLDRLTIQKDIKQFESKYDFIIIDSPGHLAAMTVKILLCSKFIFVPVQSAGFDFWSVSPLVELIKQRQEVTGGKPETAFIINRKIINSKIGREAPEVIQETFGLPVLKSAISQRICHVESTSIGETILEKDSLFATPEAIDEMNKLINEILEFVTNGNA